MTIALTKKYFWFIAISIFLGFSLTFSPGFIFCLFLTFLFCYFILKKTPKTHRKSILTIILLSLFIRLILLGFIQYYCYKQGILDIVGDGADNLLRGRMISDFLHGRAKNLPFPLSLNVYNVTLTSILNGLFSAFFGYDTTSLKYINILSVMMLGWLTCDLTSRLYNWRAAKLAMAIVLFWPMSIGWSISGLKESQFSLSILGILWCIERAIHTQGVKKQLIFIFTAAVFGLASLALRYSVLQIVFVYFICIFIFFIYKWYTQTSANKGFRRFIFILLLFFLSFVYREKIFQMLKLAYDFFIALNRGFLSSGGFNYDLLSNVDDVYHPLFIIKFMVLSLFHFLLEPLPWNIHSFPMLVVYPVIIIWYLLLAFAIIGFLKICNSIDNIARPLSLFLLAVLLTVIYSGSISNIGTAVRMRDSLMPIIAIFASFFLTEFFESEKKVDY